jgi:hypothetical protein
MIQPKPVLVAPEMSTEDVADSLLAPPLALLARVS